MTAASRLVEKVARAICLVTRPNADAVVGIHAEGGEPFHAWEEFGGEAKMALGACHAEEMVAALRNLLDDTQHRDHDCGDTENCPVLNARALLAKLEATPTEQPA
jgi:hypothetical protein